MPELIHEEIERLKEYQRDLEYLQNHYEDIKREHNNEFIAIKNENIVDYNIDSRLLEASLKEKYDDLSQFLIRYIGTLKTM